MGGEKKFEIIQGGGEALPDVKLGELDPLVEKYSCFIDQKPRWCVWGSMPDGSVGVIHWIKPCAEEEFIARRIAKLENDLGGEVRAEMTEWNESLKIEPIYKRRDVLGVLKR